MLPQRTSLSHKPSQTDCNLTRTGIRGIRRGRIGADASGTDASGTDASGADASGADASGVGMTIPSIIIASGRLASGVDSSSIIIIASGVPIGGLGGVTPSSRRPLAQAAG